MAHTSLETSRLTLFQLLQRYFLAGLFLLLPLVVSIYILMVLYSSITAPTLRLFEQVYPDLATGKWSVGVSVIAFCFNIGLVLLVGIITRHVIGRRIFNWMEKLVGQVPVLNKIYGGTKQIIQSFSPDKKGVFQQVVLVEFPRPGSFMVGFVAGPVPEALSKKIGGPAFNVFVPTTPNPTSGFLLLVAANQIHQLDVSVADGIKMVISGGAVHPEDRNL